MAEPRELTTTDSGLIWRDIPWILRRFQVKDKDLTAPPGAPAEGDRYIIAAGATGAWATHDSQLVEWHAITGASAAWHYVKPFEGFETWVEDENVSYRWNGTAWVKLPGTGTVSAAGAYSATFNATTDWTLDGDTYYRTINHALNSSQVIVQVWETSGNTLVGMEKVEIVDANNVKIRVTSDPDNRFAGRVVVMGVI